MNLQLTVPPQLALTLKKRAAEAGVDLQTFVLQTLNALGTEESEPLPLSQEQLSAKVERIIALHAKASGLFDDSRESIYAGRGE